MADTFNVASSTYNMTDTFNVASSTYNMTDTFNVASSTYNMTDTFNVASSTYNMTDTFNVASSTYICLTSRNFTKWSSVNTLVRIENTLPFLHEWANCTFKFKWQLLLNISAYIRSITSLALWEVFGCVTNAEKKTFIKLLQKYVNKLGHIF